MKAGPRGGLLFLATLVVASLLAPYLAPFAADALDLANRRAAPSLLHWFGTDELGRDVLTRVLVGARVSLAIGVLSALMSAAIGVAVGAVAGYAGRWVDDVLMRATDAILRLRLGVDGEDAVADGELALHSQIHQAARRFIRDDLEMIGLALDDAAERDVTVIRRLLVPW